MKINKAYLDELVSLAVKAMQNSYSPYSKYKVGAAVVGESDTVYTGTNVENASYGLTVCAERNAIFSAIGNGEKSIKAIVLVSSPKTLDTISSPCGACRQVMAEFAEPSMPVYIADVINGKVARVMQKKFKDFFPMPFTPKSFITEKKPKKAK